MEYRIETTAGAIIVRLKGALDRSGRGDLEMELLSLPRYGSDLILDLAEVEYISSAGLHLLLDLQRRCEQLNGNLRLTSPSNSVREVILMTGLPSSGLTVHDTLENGLLASQIDRQKGTMRGDFSYEESSNDTAHPPPPEPPKNGNDGDKMEEVHFSAFYPQEVQVEKWHTLLVYTYVPAAIESVREDARKFRGEIGEMRETKPATGNRLARGTEVTIVPSCEGVKFNPPSLTFEWQEDRQRAYFRMKAEASLADTADTAWITVYVGPLIVATLKMGMLFHQTEADPDLARSGEVNANLYHQDDIFISYSHRDTAIVRLCKKAYEALGYNVLVDFETLRSGQSWNAELMRMIDRAEIFQLFWSENSSKSAYCRQEWQYALGLKREGFIRPVYWQDPLPAPPDELSAVHFDFAPFTVQD